MLINNAVIVSSEQQRDSAMHILISIFLLTPLPSRLPHNIEQSSLSYTVGLCWLSFKIQQCIHVAFFKMHSFSTLKTSVLAFSFFSQLLSSVQFSSVTQSCPTLCDPMNRSMPGLPVHHQLPEFTQTRAHRVGDAIQPSHPLSSPSPPAPNPSQHQGLFQWVNSLYQVTKVLEFQLQHQSFPWTPRTYLLQDGLVGSPCSPRGSQESSPTPQFKSINFSVLSFLHSPTLTTIHDYWKNHSLDQTFVGRVMSLLFNMLSRLVITFLPRNKRLLISWLQSPSAVIFGAPKNKVSHCFPIYLPWSDGTGCHDLQFLNVEF